MTPIAQTSLRMPPADLARLKALYAETYPQHKSSFNSWLLSMIERGLTQ